MNKKEQNAVKINQLRRLIEAEKKNIISRYASVGKLYEKKYAEQNEEDFRPLLAAIRESEMKIEKRENEILSLEGLVRCAACGAEIDENNVFCSCCGARLTDTQEPEPAAGIRICPSCQTIFSDKEWQYCNICGTRLSPYAQPKKKPAAEKICPKCGFSIYNDEVVFCICCGTKMTEQKE